MVDNHTLPEPEGSGNQENILEIQVDTLTSIVAFLTPVAYLWLLLVVWPIFGRTESQFTWVGSLLLVACLFASLMLRKSHLKTAFWLLVVGVMGAIACALVSYRLPWLMYLLILPILFTGVFYHPTSIIAITLFAAGIVIGLNRNLFAIPFISVETISQVGIMILAGIASWLSSRNLYAALEWVRSGYEQAYRNQQIVRQQQAELVRTLKSLENTTYQIDRMNHFLMIERDRAEEAWRLKQSFAQNISHELRTPLSIIVGFSEMMVQSPEYYGVPLPVSYTRDMTTIYRNALHLQSMTNDVLELAGIDAAQVSLSLKKVDPAELVYDAVNTARSLVEQRGLTLTTTIQPGLPSIWLDSTRIRQVLFNLLNNAARFTDSGGIQVKVTGSDKAVIYSVEDTGVGISAQDIGRIFEEFEQVRRSGENRGGTGLGLTISRRFVEMHGGHIWVESTAGQGSAFYFSLPVARRDYAEVYRQPRDSAYHLHGEKDNVLMVVSDNPSVAGFLNRRLSNCRTVVIQPGGDIRSALSQTLPQAMLVDTSWEGSAAVDWQEMTRALDLKIPVLFCPMSGEKVLQSRLAVDGYLVKPVTQQDILDMIHRFKEEIKKVLIVDDDRDFMQFLARTLDNRIWHYQVLTAHNGSEALQMAQKHRPDLIFIDLMMPGLSGYEVIQAVREDPQLKGVRMVVVSGNYTADGMSNIPGPVIISKSGGLLPGTLVRLIDNLLTGEMGLADSADPGEAAAEATPHPG